jgi:hypothetical protein
MGHRAAFASALAASVAFAMIAVAPSALAQTDDATQAPAAPAKPKKKKPKPKPKPPPADTEAPADTTPVSAPAPPPPEPTPPPPAPTPEPAPAEHASAASSDSPITDVYENPTQTYYFIGLRYRGDIIPKFMVNAFVNEGGTFYSNTVGAEIDLRRDDFSMIPWIAYTSYGFGDTLFWQKNTADAPQNYSDVSSSLGAIYIGADILWSKDISAHFKFEYGAGFGIGYLFGTLTNDWVYQDPTNTAPLVGSNGNHYAPCQNQAQAPSCATGEPSNASVAQVNNYPQPNWLGGGSVPVIFPYLALPELGIRYKPIKQVETRVSVGFSLTGFFFGISADYGLPPAKKDDSKPSAH